MWARVHDTFIEQHFRAYGFSLIALEAVFGVLTLAFSDVSQRWPIVLYQVLGIAAIALAIRLRASEMPGDRFLIFGGALAAILFLYAFVPVLGVLALVGWGIIVLISVVT